MIQQNFESKSDVLKFLQKNLSKSKIEKIFDFAISDWNSNKSQILEDISKIFQSQTIIIRSSAIGEDSKLESKAGLYESVLNIPSNSKNKIKNAIEKVIKSYQIKGNINPKNQILIQSQTKNIITSGVIFSRIESSGSPYYTINYDEGSRTDTVTSGMINNTLKIFRYTKIEKLAAKWKLLIKSIKEIESLFSNTKLDIEFGITSSKKIVIFQVRPITNIKEIPQIDKKLSIIIKKNIEKFNKINSKNSNSIFSDMADWNPAEIIGHNPNNLDYSLYDYLIMQESWRKGRKIIGYQDVSPAHLMVKFGNKPYVDIIASFSSMIPQNFSSNVKHKLLNFYFEKLKNNPYFNDKVEFEILFTCFDLLTKTRLKELKKSNFSMKEIKDIENSLLEFTNGIIENFPKIQKDFEILYATLVKNRNKIISEINHDDPFSLLDSAKKLLDDCKNFGTIPFSSMARIAFIGSAILKSLQKTGNISNTQYDQFMNSIKTPLSELQHDSKLYSEGSITKSQLIKKYGHLRPGTYDINAYRYDQDKDKILSFKYLKKDLSNFYIPKFPESILSKYGLKFINISFENFVRSALSKREHLKFEFTKNISESLELIIQAGKLLGFTRSDLAYLDLHTLFSHKKFENTNNLKTFWGKKISFQKKSFFNNSFLQLPPIISEENDFEIIHYFSTKPNFISQKSIQKPIIHLTKNIDQNLDGKIVLIENADPGYDWIFTKNLAGLITRYGGVASHMAIRCSEINLPAAIGCGEILFEQLYLSSEILLDCKNQQIIILNSTNPNEFVEEKKMLKSLGYIK